MRKSRNIGRHLFSLILVVCLASGLVGPTSNLIVRASLSGEGEGWKAVNTGLGSLNVGALAIDPINTATIYAGTRGGGMFKSVNGGATWSGVALHYRYITSLAINFVDPNIIHVGTGDGGWCASTFPILKSTDGGASWSNANSPADCGGISLVIDPTSPNTLYAASEGQYLGSGCIQLWKSTDGGATWHSVQFCNPALAPYGLVIDPANPQTLYAPGDFYGGTHFPNVIDSGLFKSTDGGANWSATGLTNTSIRATAIDPLSPSTLYAGSIDYGPTSPPFRGMLKSTDGGANWLAINNGLTNISRIMAIVVDHDNPSILYIGTSGGVFKSTDGGANWSTLNDGLSNLDIQVLTLAPGNPNILYAGTSSGAFKITDGAVALPATSMLQFSASSYNMSEGDGRVVITITRTGDISSSATIDYATRDAAGLNNCDVTNGIASPRCDYATTVGTLRFAPGETSKTIFIPLVDDSFSEGAESLSVTLSNPAGAGLGASTSASVMITDNDAAMGVNPIDAPAFFVREHYIDFLGREPDPVGYQGWQDILNKCAPGDTACDQIEVSAGFFRSPEFQDRGYFTYRFYSTLGRVPHYSEFMPDIAKVSGFLTPEQLEANKAAFVNEFMARQEFQSKYSSLTDPTAYVDALLQTVGLPNHPTRGIWIDGLTKGAMTRAEVLRALTQSAEVYQKYHTEAFVVMQYFGYLRRDPDILYLEWIQTMNQNGGDYREMVNGFVNSTEYRRRFGP